MMDAEQGEVGLDQFDHRRDRLRAEELQPLALGRIGICVAELAGERLADRNQIVARIETVGDLADRFAKRLAVAQVRGAGEDVDLAAGVVDIIFAGHPVARIFEQARQRVADHRAPAMAHMHRPGRIGGDIFDIDHPALAHVRAAIGVARGEHVAQLLLPDRAVEADVDEARPGDLGACHFVQRGETRRDQLGERARIGARGLGEDHRRIGGEIAMARIARRLDRDGVSLQPGRQLALALEGVEQGVEMRGETGVERH